MPARRIRRRRRSPRGEEQAGGEHGESCQAFAHTEPAGPSARRAYTVLLLPMDSSSALAPTSLAVR